MKPEPEVSKYWFLEQEAFNFAFRFWSAPSVTPCCWAQTSSKMAMIPGGILSSINWHTSMLLKNLTSFHCMPSDAYCSYFKCYQQIRPFFQILKKLPVLLLEWVLWKFAAIFRWQNWCRIVQSHSSGKFQTRKCLKCPNSEFLFFGSWSQFALHRWFSIERKNLRKKIFWMAKKNPTLTRKSKSLV